MPTELIKDFIGKVCSVAMFNDSFGARGKITAAEENWIMLTPIPKTDTMKYLMTLITEVMRTNSEKRV